MKRLTLNSQGVAHHLALAIVIVGVAIGGTYLLVSSFADTINPDHNKSYCQSTLHRIFIDGVKGKHPESCSNSCQPGYPVFVAGNPAQCKPQPAPVATAPVKPAPTTKVPTTTPPAPTDRSVAVMSGAGTRANPYVVRCSQYATLFSSTNSGNLTGGWYCSQSSCHAYLVAHPFPAGAAATPSCAAYSTAGTKQQHLTNPKAWYRSDAAAWFYGLN